MARTPWLNFGDDPNAARPERVVESSEWVDFDGRTEVSQLVTPPAGSRVSPIDYFDDLSPNDWPVRRPGQA